MTIKTPYMLAWQTLADHAIQPHFRRSGDQVAKLIEEAIEADRKQRDIYELIAEVLDERARVWDEEMPANAAEHLRRIGAEVAIDDAWDEYIGPMLDRMADGLGA